MIPPTAQPTALADAGVYPANGSTFVVPMPEDAFMESAPRGLRISNDGEHWNGTFGVLVRALFTDLLHEGPVECVLSTTDLRYTTGERMARFSGRAVAVEGGEVVFEDGVRLNLNEVLTVEC